MTEVKCPKCKTDDFDVEVDTRANTEKYICNKCGREPK